MLRRAFSKFIFLRQVAKVPRDARRVIVHDGEKENKDFMFMRCVWIRKEFFISFGRYIAVTWKMKY